MKANYFKSLSTIETNIRTLRFLLLGFAGLCLLVCGGVLYYSFDAVAQARQRVYVMDNGQSLMLALAQEHNVNRSAEAKDHVKSFLKLLFELEPDENQIKSAYVEASFLGAQEGVNRLYNDLAEKGYYIQMVSGDVHQKLAISASDVVIDMSDSPFKFRASGTQQLIRASTITTRSLVMEGYLISVKRTDRNPHGFSVENFRIAENKDLSTITRMPTELAQ